MVKEYKMTKLKEQWEEYLHYLKRWAYEHSSMVYFKMSPASYEEWLDNEYEEEQETEGV